ncbi:hypothetical protein LOZ66_001071 [Ophidiomyces ophidiicola]|nr:hypothetical protein LOZ66_001071 [Ophidiomyces ophidiicola]
MATTASHTQEAPWHAAFPAPTRKADIITREEVLQWLRHQSDDAEYVLVDVRRADHEGGTILGSINLPAQSLHPSLATLYAIFKKANVKKVVFYCGSSQGRGTRAGGWFADYIAENDSTCMTSLVLEGGIKGWLKAGEEYVKCMDGYDEVVWKKLGVI